MQKITVKYTALFVAVLIFSPAALAVTGEQPTSIDKNVLNLGTAKDNDKITPEEKLNKEVDARINILNDVVSLSLKEIVSQNDKLEKLSNFADKSHEEEMRQDFLANLDDYKTYFEDESQKLSDLTDSLKDDPGKLNAELKGLAKEIKDYRDATYNPGISKVIEFTLLYYNASVLGTARTRLNKVQADINKLEKLGLVARGSFKTQLDKASKLISMAQDLHSQAKDIVLTDPLDINLENTKTVKPKVSPRELIEKSLSNIKTAYDVFLKISKDTRRSLGIE